MNLEYRSKVEDAFKMVLDHIIYKVDTGNATFNENEALIYLDDLRYDLSDAFDAGLMKSQKDKATQIASTAILYMVKFL